MGFSKYESIPPVSFFLAAGSGCVRAMVAGVSPSSCKQVTKPFCARVIPSQAKLVLTVSSLIGAAGVRMEGCSALNIHS